MRYKDKSSNITVVLTESATDFLILTEVGDAETVAPVLINQRHFTVTPSTNNDGVFLFQSRSDQESRVEIDKTLTRLKSDDRIKDIVPALVDNSGNVRFALPGRITVRFRNTNESAVKKYLLSIQSKIVRNFGSDLYEISIPDGVELFDFIETLNENPAIIFAEPSYYGFNDQEIDIRFATNYPQIRFNVKTPENPDEDEFFVPRVIRSTSLALRPRERKERRFPEKGDGQSVGGRPGQPGGSHQPGERRGTGLQGTEHLGGFVQHADTASVVHTLILPSRMLERKFRRQM